MAATPQLDPEAPPLWRKPLSLKPSNEYPFLTSSIFSSAKVVVVITGRTIGIEANSVSTI